MAGSLNLQATHCAKIPKIMIPANSNISSNFGENKQLKWNSNFLVSQIPTIQMYSVDK